MRLRPLVGGAGKATVVVPVTAAASGFSTPNTKSPARCFATISATTTVIGNTEPDITNNTTTLVIVVIDQTD